jgi:hypothetical protein
MLDAPDIFETLLNNHETELTSHLCHSQQNNYVLTDVQILILFKPPSVIDLLSQRKSVVRTSQIIGHKIYIELKNKLIFLDFIKYIGLQKKKTKYLCLKNMPDIW